MEGKRRLWWLDKRAYQRKGLRADR